MATSTHRSRARWAIEEFQVEHGLYGDGVCGPLTQALVEAHGH